MSLAGGKPPGSSVDELETLRDLIIRPERDAIDRLRRRVEERSIEVDDVSRVLPDAIFVRAAQDDHLERALSPTLEKSIQTSVRRNPQALADAIAPILGPAIRRSIQTTLATMFEGLNRAVEESFSPQGLKWRWHAMRSGKPYAEIALLHHFVYRVEQIFLIQSEAGLLLTHVASDGAYADPDMVSSMLSAILDFAQDSLDASPGESIDQVTLSSGQRLLVVTGRRSMLAAVVRGPAPPAYRERLQGTLQKIEHTREVELENFDGDVTAFQACQPALEDLLVAERREEKQRRFRGLVPMLILAALILLVVRAWSIERRVQREYEGLAAELLEEPGWASVQAERDGRRVTVRGLRDPLAEPAERFSEEWLERGILSELNFDLRPFASLDPAIRLRRARQRLEPPEGVLLELEGDVLSARGTAPHGWIQGARRRAAGLPGVRVYQDSGLKNPQLDALERVLARLRGLTRPDVPSAWVTLREDLLELDQCAAVLDVEVRIAIEPSALTQEALIDVRTLEHVDLSPASLPVFLQARVLQAFDLSS